MPVALDAGPIALQTSGGAAAAAGLSALFLLLLVGVPLVLSVITLAGRWAAFEKVGEPGWAGIIPVYNFYRRVVITDNPTWFVVGLFVPLLNLYVLYRVNRDFVGIFGQGLGFTVGILVLSVVFWPLLGFGGYTASHGSDRTTEVV